MNDEAIRHDGGKARYDLIPADALHALAVHYTAGARKYGDDNWLKGMSWRRMIGSMMRHAWAWVRGEEFDEEGNPHLIAVAWNALGLYVYQRRGLGTDDRIPIDPPPTITVVPTLVTNVPGPPARIDAIEFRMLADALVPFQACAPCGHKELCAQYGRKCHMIKNV